MSFIDELHQYDQKKYEQVNRRKQIIDLSQEEEDKNLLLPCYCLSITKNNFQKHLQKCETLSYLCYQEQKVYQCQFNSFHVFISKEDRNEHEKKCLYYTENKFLHDEPRIQWDKKDGTTRIIVKQQILLEIKNNNNQVPQKILKRVEDQKINFNHEKNRKQTDRKKTIDNFNRFLLSQQQNQDKLKLELSIKYQDEFNIKINLVRINDYINQYLKQAQQKFDLKSNQLEITDLIDIDENGEIFSIIVDQFCKNQDPEIYKYLQFEYVYNNVKDKERLFSGLGKFRIGVIRDYYESNQELLIFFISQTHALGQYLQKNRNSDCGIIIYNKNQRSDKSFFYKDIEDKTSIIPKIVQLEQQVGVIGNIDDEEEKQKANKELIMIKNQKQEQQIGIETLKLDIQKLQNEITKVSQEQSEQEKEYKKEQEGILKDITHLKEKQQQLENAKIQLEEQKEIMKFNLGKELEEGKNQINKEILDRYNSEQNNFQLQSDNLDNLTNLAQNKYDEMHNEYHNLVKNNQRFQKQINNLEKKSNNIDQEIDKLANSINDIDLMLTDTKSTTQQHFLCKICREKQARLINFPCLHLTLCYECWQTNKQFYSQFCILCWNPNTHFIFASMNE